MTLPAMLARRAGSFLRCGAFFVLELSIIFTNGLSCLSPKVQLLCSCLTPEWLDRRLWRAAVPRGRSSGRSSWAKVQLLWAASKNLRASLLEALQLLLRRGGIFRGASAIPSGEDVFLACCTADDRAKKSTFMVTRSLAMMIVTSQESLHLRASHSSCV